MALHKRKPAFLLALYLIISLLILHFDVNPSVKSLRDFFVYIALIPYAKVNSAAASAARLGSTARELFDARSRLAAARSENKKLLYELAKVRTLPEENARLRELLGYKKAVGEAAVIASIIAKPPDQYDKSFIVDKGIKDGVRSGSPVYGFYKGRFGAVGFLADVGDNISTVIVLTNRVSKVPVRIAETGTDGVLAGADNAELNMMWIPAESEAKIGDTVVTSPVSDIFPAGRPVGVILAVEGSPYLPFKSARVRPVIPAFQLTEVFIE
jgi:rod shape-determining protein MreC